MQFLVRRIASKLCKLFRLSKTLLAAIYTAQCFGLFPIDIRHKNPTNFDFRWKSFLTAFSLTTLFTSITTAYVFLESQIRLGPLTPRNIIGVIFFSCCFTIALLFFRLSRKWRMLSVCWMKTESLFVTDGYAMPKTSWSLAKRVRCFAFVYLALAFVEHLLSLVSSIASNEAENPIETFFIESFSFLTERLHRKSVYLGLTFEYLSFCYTVYWNFLNLFIILVAMGLSFLYEKIYWRCESFNGLIIEESVWAEIRNHHVKVSELVRLVNSYMNEMITVACLNDGYFLLSQMINITV